MEATWLSKVDAEEKVGSMVAWLKSKVDVEYLLRTERLLLALLTRSTHFLSLGTTAIRATTVTVTDTSRRRARVRSACDLFRGLPPERITRAGFGGCSAVT